MSKEKAIDILSTVSSLYNGPKKASFRKWFEKNREDFELEDELFEEALKDYIKKYKKQIKDVFDVEKIDSSFYTKEKIQELRKVLEEQKDHSESKDTEATDSQKMAIDFLDENQNSNVVVSLTTGGGKTLVSFNEIEKYLADGNYIIFSAPTNELAKDQYEQFWQYIYAKNLDTSTFKTLNFADIKDLSKLDDSCTNVLFMTHHMAEIFSNQKLDKDVDFWTIDEIHVGEEGKYQNEEEIYRYPTFKAYQNFLNNGGDPRILGLTAFSKHQDDIAEKFDIDNWFVGSRKKDYKHREYVRHDREENLESQEFLDVKLNIETIRNYIIEQICNQIRRVYEMDLNFPENLWKYFKKNNLLSKTYIENYYEREIKRYFTNRSKKQGKYSREFYQDITIKFLISKLKKINQIKKSFENDDYKSALDKVKDFEDDLKKHFDSYDSKKQSADKWANNDKYGDYKNRVDSMTKMTSRIKGWSYIVYDHLYWNEKQGKLHPKAQKTFDIVERNSIEGRTTMVFVENKEVIQRLTNLAREKGYNAGFFTGGQKNKSQEFIQGYFKEQIDNSNLDVVFTTSVMKLGVNFDINELVLYNMPQNEKDLLQFVGRIGRFKTGAKVHFIYPKNTLEWYRLGLINKAQHELREQFNQGEQLWDNWLKHFHKGDNDSKKEYADTAKSKDKEVRGLFQYKEKCAENGEIFVRDLVNKNIPQGEIVNSRFKVLSMEYKNEGIVMEISDSSSENTFKVLVKGFNSRSDMISYKNSLGYENKGENIFYIRGEYDSVKGLISIDVSKIGGKAIKKMSEESYERDDFENQQKLF